MAKKLIRPNENAYPQAPFFHLSYKAQRLPVFYFVGILFLNISATVFYGYGVFVHTIMFQLVSLLLFPILRVIYKYEYVNSLTWNADVLLLATLIPVSWPWWTAFIACPIFLLGMRIFFVAEKDVLFQAHAVTFLILNSLFLPIDQMPSMFHLMPKFDMTSWIDASSTLFLSHDLDFSRDFSFFIGNIPGGSIYTVLSVGIVLTLCKVFHFGSIFFYFCSIIFWLFVFSDTGKIFLTSKEHIPHLLEACFASFFLLHRPQALENYKKYIHAFIAASLGLLLSIHAQQFPFYKALIMANLWIPLMNILPSYDFHHKAQEKTIEKQSLGWSLFLIVSLMSAVYVLARNQ